jgi:hypothetical protein
MFSQFYFCLPGSRIMIPYNSSVILIWQLSRLFVSGPSAAMLNMNFSLSFTAGTLLKYEGST